MSAQQVVDSKKALSSVVTLSFLILISILAVIALWFALKPVIQKSPLEQTICLDVSRTLSIEKACYLNDGELEVVINRALDSPAIDSLVLSFSPYEARWMIRDKKCSDVRVLTGRYGEYCKVLSAGMKMSYVFNMTGIVSEYSVALIANSKGVECAVGSIDIGSC